MAVEREMAKLSVVLGCYLPKRGQAMRNVKWNAASSWRRRGVHADTGKKTVELNPKVHMKYFLVRVKASYRHSTRWI